MECPGANIRKPIWKSTFTFGMDVKGYCNLDYFTLDYDYDDFAGIDLEKLRI